MTSYRLHYFPESGNSYKIALMLTLCGQIFEPIWTDFAGGVTRTAEWRSTVNQMGEIPVLEEMGRASRKQRQSCFGSRSGTAGSAGEMSRSSSRFYVGCSGIITN